MSETENGPNDFESVIGSLETSFMLAQLEKRAMFTLAVAEVAGAVLTTAMEKGVPYDMAKEMAADYWHSEMALNGVILIADDEDDE